MDSVLKLSILIVQILALHQNGVEFRQWFNSAIRTSVTAPYDDVLRREIENFHLFTLPLAHFEL